MPQPAALPTRPLPFRVPVLQVKQQRQGRQREVALPILAPQRVLPAQVVEHIPPGLAE